MNSPIRTTVYLEGAQTVRTIEAARNRLHAELARGDAVVIHSEAIDELDLSLIQLLLAAKRSADCAGKSLTLASPVSEKLHAALHKAGILTARGNSADRDFWLSETSAR